MKYLIEVNLFLTDIVKSFCCNNYFFFFNPLVSLSGRSSRDLNELSVLTSWHKETITLFGSPSGTGTGFALSIVMIRLTACLLTVH